MSVKLVAYTLNRSPKRKHVKIEQIINSSFEAIKISESAYLVDSRGPLEEVFEKVDAALDASDDLITIHLGQGLHIRARTDNRSHDWLKAASAGFLL